MARLSDAQKKSVRLSVCLSVPLSDFMDRVIAIEVIAIEDEKSLDKLNKWMKIQRWISVKNLNKKNRSLGA